jgi:biopolymer transport protein ExbD
MPIHHPGTKFRHSKILSKRKGKRELVALLSLTAMVDMFTVLVIFLLQNYNATGQVIYIPKDVTLPKAEKIKELMPAIVVTISNKEILIDKNNLSSPVCSARVDGRAAFYPDGRSVEKSS